MFQNKSYISNDRTESLIMRVVIGNFDGSDDVSYNLPQPFLSGVIYAV